MPCAGQRQEPEERGPAVPRREDEDGRGGGLAEVVAGDGAVVEAGVEPAAAAGVPAAGPALAGEGEAAEDLEGVDAGEGGGLVEGDGEQLPAAGGQAQVADLQLVQAAELRGGGEVGGGGVLQLHEAEHPQRAAAHEDQPLARAVLQHSARAQRELEAAERAFKRL